VTLFRLNIPNLISLARLLAVPFCVWLIVKGQLMAAFWIFVLAGLSDAADGYIAKRFNLRTVIGGYLDPIADKALLVSVFVTLGFANYLDSWIVIVAVFRDVLIVCGALLIQVLFQSFTVQPLLSSKLNTVFQFLLVALALGLNGYGIDAGPTIDVMTYLAGTTTVWSGMAYLVLWSRRVATMESSK
jgi:cardiolipin synthase (CMP-forming)